MSDKIQLVFLNAPRHKLMTNESNGTHSFWLRGADLTSAIDSGRKIMVPKNSYYNRLMHG